MLFRYSKHMEQSCARCMACAARWPPCAWSSRCVLGMQMRMRDTIRREKSIKVIVEFKREGELVAYAEDEGTWVSELPEEHRSPVKQ